MLAWQVLNCLRRSGSLSQCEVARKTGQHPAGISRLLDALEGQREVRRKRDGADRRRLLVELTAKAHQRLKSLDLEVAAAAKPSLAPLRSDEQRRLKALLTKLVGA